MAGRRCLRHVSVVVGTFVVGAGMSSCTQSMPVPAMTSPTPISSATSASGSGSTATTTTASTCRDLDQCRQHHDIQHRQQCDHEYVHQHVLDVEQHTNHRDHHDHGERRRCASAQSDCRGQLC